MENLLEFEKNHEKLTNAVFKNHEKLVKKMFCEIGVNAVQWILQFGY